MAELWDSVGTFLSFEARNVNVHEWGKVMTELGYRKWHLVLAMLCDIRYILDDVNTKVQGQQKLEPSVVLKRN
jgi:hypothetical protein